VVHEPGVPEAVLLRARADAVRLAIAPGENAPEGLAGTVAVVRFG